jgi:hypothetical protein
LPLPLVFGIFKTIIIQDSWVNNVKQYLIEALPYPEWKEEYTLNAYTITLFNNGLSTFVNSSNGNDFSSYLLNIMAKADTEVNGSLSDAFVSNITQNE